MLKKQMLHLRPVRVNHGVENLKTQQLIVMGGEVVIHRHLVVGEVVIMIHLEDGVMILAHQKLHLIMM